MWSPRKQLLILSLTLVMGLSACGFQPMYGDASTHAESASALQGNIIILPVGGGSGRFRQVLKNALEDRFNPHGASTANAAYTLQVNLSRLLIPAVVRSDGTILRYDVRFETDYILSSNGTKMKPYNGKVRRISSYNVVPNANFATYEAEESLNERMLKEIAEDYVMRISGLLSNGE